MLKETGLPPVWNGKTLIPWKDYHKKSIEFASQCHGQLGIDQPHAGPDWPSAGVEVLGEDLLVVIGGRSALTRHLEPAFLAASPPSAG